ncbi:MAG TPA: M14 family zinc carboxypeptidase [Polyangiaceae bacterium]|nr:M14 family zinc carboxypeptidase [Polyangiaceae bacterium]
MRRWGLGVVAVLVLFGSAACSSASPSQGDGEVALQPASHVVQYRVHDAISRSDDLAAAGLDLLEKRQNDDLFVLGDESVGDQIREMGFTVSVDREIVVPRWTPPALRVNNEQLSPEDVNETYYGGYHTVNAHYSHLDQVASAHPDLAKVVTYGQSYKKQQGTGGYDLKAICITKLGTGDCTLNPNSTKPRFLLYTQIHAREITTGDVSWRWVDYLVNNYGINSTVTSLVNSEELWIVPIANPDGTDIVQQGGSNPLLQRKNGDAANETTRTCSVPNHGVDLNRNFGSHWGGASTTTNQCGETYLGPKADSEIETQNSEALWRNLFPAVRGSSASAASPTSAKGIMLTLHSDASVVMFPWYYSSSVHTGNDTTQRAMAQQMSNITGYPYGQSGEVLYTASGSTDDWIYDKLGTSVFTIEVGDTSFNGSCSGFLPPYACQSDTFWPMMQQVLLYLAPKAAAPFAP